MVIPYGLALTIALQESHADTKYGGRNAPQRSADATQNKEWTFLNVHSH
jgi:hypothetical protein